MNGCFILEGATTAGVLTRSHGHWGRGRTFRVFDDHGDLWTAL